MAPRSAPKGARREFDREASAYDRTARATMPGYSDLHRTLVWGIPFVPTRSFRVLELGVGTGTLTAEILEGFPQAHLTGVDLSPRMITRARAKLRPYRDRVELVAGDLGRFEEGTYERRRLGPGHPPPLGRREMATVPPRPSMPLPRRILRRRGRPPARGPDLRYPICPDRFHAAVPGRACGGLDESAGGVAWARKVRPPFHPFCRARRARAGGVPSRGSALALLRSGRRLGVSLRRLTPSETFSSGPLLQASWPGWGSLAYPGGLWIPRPGFKAARGRTPRPETLGPGPTTASHRADL